jgi:hypothetical protein
METRNLAATIDSKSITVSGEVYVSRSNMTASLVRKVPQGIVSTTLALDIETSQGQGGGLQVFTWVPVGYDEAASKGQFNRVSIHFDREPLATVDVQEAA